MVLVEETKASLQQGNAESRVWLIQCTSRTAFVIAGVALKGSESSIASTEMQPFPRATHLAPVVYHEKWWVESKTFRGHDIREL
jgi:hypothetical protein